MNPRERAIRLADIAARQRRAAAAAEGLRREYWLARTVNGLLDMGVADSVRKLVAEHKGTPDPNWVTVAAALTAAEREEAEVEKQLARKKAADLRIEADLTLWAAGAT